MNSQMAKLVLPLAVIASYGVHGVFAQQRIACMPLAFAGHNALRPGLSALRLSMISIQKNFAANYIGYTIENMKLVNIQKYLFFLLLISGTACSTVGARFLPADPPNPETALVYIYRPGTWKNMLISPAVLIDGEEKFLMHNSGYTFFYLKPGLHTFTLKLSDRYKGLAQIQFDMQATQSYFVKVETNFGPAMFGRVFRITQVPDSVGRMEIQERGYLDPSQTGKFSKSYILEDN